VGVAAALGVGAAVGVGTAVLPAPGCAAGLEGWPAPLDGWVPVWLPGCGRACSASTPQDASATISSAAAAARIPRPGMLFFPMTKA
jgi:hypothetical protein